MSSDDHSRPTIAISPLNIPHVPHRGDIVDYHFRGPNGIVVSRPATITSVDAKNKETVNLFVFFEPGDQRGSTFAADVPPHDDGAFQPHTWSPRTASSPPLPPTKIFG